VKYVQRWLAPNSMMMLSSPALLTRRLSLAVEESSPSSTAAAPPQMPPFDHTPQPYTGPRADEILAKRKKFLNPAMFLYYKKHLNIVEGKMQYLYDENGRRYLDAFAGIVTVSVGHCHPTVVDAVVQQTRLLQHTTTIYLHHAIAEYAEALAQRMPGNLKVVYFVNSGSEANDMAMMMARLYTGSFDVIALRNAYHGMSPATMGLTAHSTWKYNVAQVNPTLLFPANLRIVYHLLPHHSHAQSLWFAIRVVCLRGTKRQAK
jgi:alanine-glyoxylate transaminase/(R)-3-amino-2-methylpropionate-pyruvate transaminase